MNKNQKIYEKINQAVRLLCDVYDILNEHEEKIVNDTENKLFSIAQFLKKYPEFTQGQIRNYIFQNIKDFKEKVTIRVGKKIYIKEQDFFNWMKNEI